MPCRWFRASVLGRRARFAARLFVALLTIVSARAGEGYSDLRPASAAGIPTALIELDGTGSENPDGGVMTYSWKQIDGPRVELSDPAAAKPYFRTGKPGLYRFELVVSANGMDSEPFVVEIMIERDNQPPIAKAPREIRGEVGKELEIDGRESFDPEGGHLTYRWRSLTRGLDIPVEAQGSPVLRFEPRMDGVFEVELVVSDGETVSHPWVTTLAVKPRPRPPVAIAKAVPREIPTAQVADHAMAPPAGARPVARIEGPAVSQLGGQVTLTAKGSRASDGSRMEYLWRQKSGPFVSDFEMLMDGAAERFLPPRAGDYEFELVVSDGVQESEPFLHRLKIVNESEPPVAVVVAPTRAMPGQLIKLDATQSYDLEGSSLVFRWRQTGGPKITRYLIDEKIGDSSPAFHPPSAGVYSFELVVSNGKLQSKPIEIDIEVGDAKRPPSLSITGPDVANTGERLSFGAVAEYADGRNLSFAWRQVDGPVMALTPTGGRHINLAAPVPGRYVFDLSALEDGKVVATARRTLEVFSPPPGSAPAPVPAAAVAPPSSIAPLPLPAQSVQPPSYAPPPASQPRLAPLIDMPAQSSEGTVASLPSLPAPSPAASASGTGLRAPTARPVAQIHPSSLGNGVNFLDPAPVSRP